MTSVPASHQDLVSDDVRAFAFLATLFDDGRPQVTPVWFSMDGADFLINTARGRAKDENMTADPRVAFAIPDPHNPYRYLEVRGLIVSSTEEGAEAHIHALSRKYFGRDYHLVPGEVRVIYRVQPQRILPHG